MSSPAISMTRSDNGIALLRPNAYAPGSTAIAGRIEPSRRLETLRFVMPYASPRIEISANDRFWQIVLQKSKVAGLEIFRENTTRELVADSYTLSPVTEIAWAFNVKR